jgi:formamidopyrimidine-DNA glycosylase
VPELPEVETVRRTLHRSMHGQRIVRVNVRRPDLRRPFPPRFARRLTGQTVTSVSRRGKYIIASLTSGEALVIHLGMSGSFAITKRGISRASAVIDPHDHVVIELASGTIVTFNDPRRFGLMDLVRADRIDTYPSLGAMGAEPLDVEFDAAVLARACQGRRVALKVALLDQRLVAGLGNIYAGEALHHAALSPRRRASTLATATGAPRESAVRLAAGIKAVLRNALARKRGDESGRFLVYEREGEPCLRPGCPGTIRRITQAGRSTYYCPVCQR